MTASSHKECHVLRGWQRGPSLWKKAHRHYEGQTELNWKCVAAIWHSKSCVCMHECCLLAFLCSVCLSMHVCEHLCMCVMCESCVLCVCVHVCSLYMCMHTCIFYVAKFSWCLFLYSALYIICVCLYYMYMYMSMHVCSCFIVYVYHVHIWSRCICELCVQYAHTACELCTMCINACPYYMYACVYHVCTYFLVLCACMHTMCTPYVSCIEEC